MFMTRVSDEALHSVKEGTNNKPFLPDLSSAKMDRSFVSGPQENTRNRIFKTAHTASKRAQSNIQEPNPSRYRAGMIPTENLKFSQFLDIIYNSKLSIEEMKQETRDYVQILETNYTDKIREL